MSRDLTKLREELEKEVKERKKQIEIIKADDKILNMMCPQNLYCHTYTHPKTQIKYLVASPPVSPKLVRLSTCLGVVGKISEEEIEEKKREAVEHFKKKWLAMRDNFEILKGSKWK